MRVSLLPLVVCLGTLVNAAQAGSLGEQPLQLEKGDTICLMGGVVAERMQNHGWLELSLQTRFKDLELSVRNLGFGADELAVHQRTMNFGKFSADGMASDLANERFVPWDRYLDHCGANVVFAFFGYNESFGGEAGLVAYRSQMESFIDHVLGQDYGGQGAPELVLFSSIPHEDMGNPDLPDGRAQNRNIALYNAAGKQVAADRGVRFVDVFQPMQAIYEANPMNLSINGIHLNSAGNRELAGVIDSAIFGPDDSTTPGWVNDSVLATIIEKNLLWFNRYRVTDGYNVYGGRSRKVYNGAADGVPYANFEVLQRELDHIDGLVAARDRKIWDLVNGREHTPDLSDVLPLMPVATNKQGGGSGGSHIYLDPESSEGKITTAEGMRVEIFADERQFPELVNPVQMAWDTRGRLWVATWQTYPHWTVGQPMNDKLIILEDTNGDGYADKSTIFADNLHNPTGFEFWNGGVLLGAAPNLLFLRDTDGDDHVDETEILLHGLSSADTHHGANSFVIGPGGGLYFQEGTFHQSQVESIHGPVRNRNGCVWRFNPRTWTVERYIPYNYANPHGHVFDRWGQDFMTDGTGNVNYYSLPFSGYLPEPMKHSSYFAFFPQRSRPAGGTEILSSRHFPDEMQGNYLIANVIGFRGIFNYKVKDDHSGFGADEQEPLVESTELNFRPVDLEVGPDGAVYFLDWHNAIIGHLQHHLRDPSRDNAHGRVYRVTYEGRDLLEPAKIAGESIEHLIDLLKSPEDRTRYRSRLELSGRDSLQVVHATAKWVEQLDENDPQHEHNLLEALWLLQQHNQMDGELLQRVLDSPDPRARAAATRVVRYSRHLLPNALDLIGTSVLDENPRVRLEAVVAASFFRGAAAATIALEALRQPTDKFLTYALKETMRALEQDWKAALRAGETIAEGNPAGIEFLLGRVSSEELVHLPRVPAVLEALLTRAGVDVATRLSAADELASLRKTSITEEVLAAIKTVDQSGGGQATLVLKQLGGLLRQLSVSSPGPSREQLLDLAENSQRVATRAMGYAALIELERSNVAAWASAGESSARLLGLLQSTQWLTDSTLRADMVARIRPLMFAPPEGVSVASPGTGLDVAFYEPSPPNARRETLSSLSPTEEVWSDHFQLNLAPALESDSFGLAFSGVLFAPRDGTYTFSTNSDDGSRLYIGERSVVENDGPHGMVSRSGEIFLSKGPHPILVTFFESGGGQGLQVHWSGPGVERQLIPASVLGTGIGGKIQESAVRAMAFAPGSGDQKLTDAAELIEQGISWEACLQLMASGASVLHGSEAATRALEVMLPRLAALPAEERTGADMESVLELCRSLASGLPSDAQASYLARLGQLGGTRIEIATLPHQMLYDLDEFWVQAGRPVTIEFTNNDVMPHNLVVTIPGAMELVGQAAEALGGSGQGANQFVPETPSVLWFTSLVLPGQTESLTFTAPSELGDHPYVCTYPGHWRVMNGVMHVIAPGEEGGAIARRSSDLSHVEPRAFVQDWTLADLEPILEQGWLAQASYDRGEKLFAATGCINCHTVGCEGQGAGPDLIDVGQKYEPGMLLRHIFEPSLEVLEDYSFYIFEVEGQSDVIGRIVEDDGKNLHILQTLLEPDSLIQIEKAKIIERFDTGLSPMPTGLLVTLTKDEIRDLVSYVMNPRPMEEEEHGALEVSSAPEDPWIVFEGGDGPGKGKHVVLIAGDEEYRSEEALPMLARILSQRHGFRCTVLFSTDKENGEINPEEQTYIPGIEVLDDADMMVCFLRFRELPDEDMAHFVNYVESGKPILGLRTATHAFDYRRDKQSPHVRYSWNSGAWVGGFGRQVLGDTWISHHGHHGQESTRGVVEDGNAAHPVLRGVSDVWGPTDVYGIRNLPASATVLLRGQVLQGMQPDSAVLEGAKNQPMMPIAWARELPAANGSTQRIVCSTIGASTDCESEDLRRLFVNACYWGVGLEDQITATSNVDVVGEYHPTAFGFGGYTKGVRAYDHAR